jgi:DNA ligase (NAD+)
MDIRGLGERTTKQLLETGLVRDYADLYGLGVEELLRLDGFADLSARNLVASIDASRGRPLSRVLYALGIRHAGTHAATVLAKRFVTAEALMEASPEDLAAVHGIGATTAEAVAAFFRDAHNRDLIARLGAAGVNLIEPVEVAEQSSLDGLTFVVTGTHGMSRKEITNLIERHGGRVTGSVSRTTSYLVAGDSPGSKLDRARELGVDIIDEAALIALAAGTTEEKS